MMRTLTAREREVLEAMIRHGREVDQAPIPDAARRGWLDLLPELRVAGVCSCGTCPSIELTPGEDSDEPRIVLHAGTDDIGVILFIDQGRPSYLEGYPLHADAAILEFPPADRLEF